MGPPTSSTPGVWERTRSSSSPPPFRRHNWLSSSSWPPSIGLDALVEVHDEGEADVALSAGATIVGVNQRDLFTFEVDPARAERVARALPAGVTRVAESGIRTGDDARRLADAGFDAILVGESLVVAADPALAVRQLRAAAGTRVGT